jgi:hypothetical protein
MSIEIDPPASTVMSAPQLRRNGLPVHCDSEVQAISIGIASDAIEAIQMPSGGTRRDD